MASTKLSTTIVFFSLLFSLTFHTCITCGVPCAPKTKTPSVSPAGSSKYCPKDTLKMGVCSDILGIGGVVGSPVSSRCCAVLSGLTDAEAAACLCTAIKASVLGVDLNVPVSFSLLISTCKKTVPLGYQCG